LRFAVVETLGLSIEKFILIFPQPHAVYRKSISGSVVSRVIEATFAPFASVNVPFAIVALRWRRLGEIRFPFASRSLKTHIDSFVVTTDEETGINSI
jgi:hypothetical protein